MRSPTVAMVNPSSTVVASSGLCCINAVVVTPSVMRTASNVRRVNMR